ncbi:hypothetical protein G4H71_09615 [Rhodococcus triatomae]|uniref:Uncharacterized protein n=1 Tax=Rhodococcus triatomae TaxID=300028 RepID=A0A1G8HN15_9NOCA|nr:hypothetical protein [Rhodococcus triatomae]QNG20831.1 hypothetical protein G4H72_20770 [Rhodococcus triatomae]QNG23254.1 hypothetical protein G4H71_09615 [Rhodococcus triatomae]SDI08014.1 hypothetical protein SAMN05444695_10512 [Rhodococcus triatomae]
MTEFNFGPTDPDDEFGDYARDDTVRVAPPVPSTGGIMMDLAADRLPQDISLLPHWIESVDPTKVGGLLLGSYHQALGELGQRYIDAGMAPPSAVPPRRHVIPHLLRTDSLGEYRETSSRLLGSATTVGCSSVLGRADTPVISVTADRTGISAIAVDSEWVSGTQEISLRSEFLYAVDAIRRQRPELVEEGRYAETSDQELEDLNVEHLRRLNGV